MSNLNFPKNSTSTDAQEYSSRDPFLEDVPPPVPTRMRSTNPFLHPEDLIVDSESQNLSSIAGTSRQGAIKKESTAGTNQQQGPEKTGSFTKYFDSKKWVTGEKMHLKILNIWSPTTFWVTPKFQELCKFLINLRLKYLLDKKRLQPSELCVKKKCVVYFNGFYHRAIVMSSLFSEPDDVMVFLVDDGGYINLPKNEIFEMDENLTKIPQFIVRASLAHICPKNRGGWEYVDKKLFESLALNKSVFAEVVGVDNFNKILELNVCLLHADGVTPLISVNQMLVQHGNAEWKLDQQPLRKEQCPHHCCIH